MIYYFVDEDETSLYLIYNYDEPNNLVYSICIKFQFFQGNLYDSFLCFDVNFGILRNDFNYLETKKFDFGLAKEKTYEDDFNFYRDLQIIYNTNRKINEALKIFNSSKYTPDRFVLKNDKYN